MSVLKERLQLLKDQRNICQYCEKRYRSNKLSIDHVFPRSRVKGAPLKVLACRTCNMFKGTLMPVEFIGKLEVILGNIKKLLHKETNDAYFIDNMHDNGS